MENEAVTGEPADGFAMTGLAVPDRAAVKVFRALSHPTRYHIVRTLVEREDLGCAELMALYGLSAPALSYHTRLLQECGLLDVRRDGAYHFYRLNREQVTRFAPSLLAARALAVL
jgi:ArsR family transcriptional regulator